MTNSHSLSELAERLPSLEAIHTEIRRREALRNREITELSTEATRERCKTLSGFVREAWHIVEPTQPYVHGWVIDAICEHLEAVTYGRILRLLINVPPGMMKSLLTSVFWPAWEWGPAGLASYRYMTTSYSLDYAKRDSRRMRDLVLSDWYQELWPATELIRAGEESFANKSTGWRESMPFKSLTGGRGHRVIIDDPHSTETAESEADRKTAIRIFRESVPSRMVDPTNSAIVIIMQRLHVEDVSGVAMALKLGYEHLMLPMEFEPDRRCKTSIGFKDPRSYEGELLFPERFPRDVVERDKIPMGSYAVAGQFQQRPTLREGGLFKRSWFTTIPAAPVGVRWVRHWDLAATKEQVSAQGARTAGVLLGRTASGRFCVGHVVKERAEGQGVRSLIKSTALADRGKYGDVEISFNQDPGQAGKVQAQDLILMMAGYVAHAMIETGAKETRAEPFAAQCEAGNVDLVEGDWNEEFLDELCDFPAGKFKDQVDGASGAFARLIGNTVFNTPDASFTQDATLIQSIWKRCAAIEMDTHAIAGLWAAYHTQTDTIYLYDELVAPRSAMAIHAEALIKRGKWIPVLFDLEGKKRTEDEGTNIAMHLADLSVDLYEMPTDMRAALDEIQSRLASGRLKVFSHLSGFLAQYRRYRRNEKNEIVEEDDLLIRCLGVIVSGLSVAKSENLAASDEQGYDPVLEGERGATGY